MELWWPRLGMIGVIAALVAIAAWPRDYRSLEQRWDNESEQGCAGFLALVFIFAAFILWDTP